MKLIKKILITHLGGTKRTLFWEEPSEASLWEEPSVLSFRRHQAYRVYSRTHISRTHVQIWLS